MLHYYRPPEKSLLALIKFKLPKIMLAILICCIVLSKYMYNRNNFITTEYRNYTTNYAFNRDNIDYLDIYKDKLLSIEINPNNIHKEIMYHSSMPYTESIRKQFRKNLIYDNSILKNYIDASRLDITNLWVCVEDNNSYIKKIDNTLYEKAYTGYYGNTIEILPINLYGVNTTFSELRAQIKNQYTNKTKYYYTLKEKDGSINLLDSHSNIPIASSTIDNNISNYFSLDNSTVKKYIRYYYSLNTQETTKDEAIIVDYINVDEDIKKAKFSLKDQYKVSKNETSTEKNLELTFGFPIYKGYARDKNELLTDIEIYTDHNYKYRSDYIVPIYINGKLVGFNGILCDNWMLMECISLLYANNSKENPLCIRIAENGDLVVQDTRTRVTAIGYYITIDSLNESDKNSLTNYSIVNINQNCNYLDVDYGEFNTLIYKKPTNVINGDYAY